MTGAKLFEEDTIMKNNSSIKTVVAVGIGAALFFVLGRFVAIPSPVPNTNISLQYAVLALLATMYGPVAGGLIGFIGHALIDLSWGEVRGGAGESHQPLSAWLSDCLPRNLMFRKVNSEKAKLLYL